MGKALVVGVLIAFPASAAMAQPATTTGAPPGSPETRYCMHVGPVTGYLAQIIECWTRQEWADQGVDVDKEWAKSGVRTID